MTAEAELPTGLVPGVNYFDRRRSGLLSPARLVSCERRLDDQ